MSYNKVRSDTRSHFNEIQVFLNFIKQQESNAHLTSPMEVKIMRGLFYVHLYSAIEKTVNEVVKNTLILISSKNVKHKHFNLAFNTISLMNIIKSLKDSNYKHVVSKSNKLFEYVGSGEICEIDETIFSKTLQNIWIHNIKDVKVAFGMKSKTLMPRVVATVNEIVEKRNSVAHGRESALIIGERHRADILREKLNLIQQFCNQFIDDFEEYYNGKKYLKPVVKKNYT